MGKKSSRLKFNCDKAECDVVRYGSLEHKVLKFLSEFSYAMLDASLPKKYGSCRIWREIFGLDRSESQKESQKWKKIFFNTLSRLKSKKLVVKAASSDIRKWKLNLRGKLILKQLEERISSKDNRLRIFIFDIPEEKRYYRDWLRRKLVFEGYKMLQRSVWIGRRPLSQDLMVKIYTKKLWTNIHFFEVKEEGTLDNLNMSPLNKDE